MTTKNAKTILFASLIAAMILPFSGMMMVEAASSENANDKAKELGVYIVKQGSGEGKEIIKYGQEKIRPTESIQIHEISVKLNDPSLKHTEPQIQAMRDQMEKLQQRLYDKAPKISTEKETYLEQHREMFNLHITPMIESGEHEELLQELPFIRLGIDKNEQSIKFGFLEENLTPEKTAKYFKYIRNIVGNDVDILFFATNEYTTTTCTSQTADCDPLEGGIKIQIDGSENCSLGFKAKKLEGTTWVPGFITAGHCSDGSSSPDLNVEQATSPDVGQLKLESFTANSKCDCSWVEVDSGITVDDVIYPNTEPASVATPTVNTATTGMGFTSGTLTGDIDDSSEDVWIGDPDEGDTYMRSQLIIDFVADDGDSGGSVFKDSNDQLIGIISASNGFDSVVSAATNISSLSSSIEWDFT